MIKSEIVRGIRQRWGADSADPEWEEQQRIRRDAILAKADAAYLRETLPDRARAGSLGSVVLIYGTDPHGRRVLEALRFPGEEAPKTVEEAVRDGTLKRFGIF